LSKGFLEQKCIGEVGHHVRRELVTGRTSVTDSPQLERPSASTVLYRFGPK
jgi:hypothetical protein